MKTLVLATSSFWFILSGCSPGSYTQLNQADRSSGDMSEAGTMGIEHVITLVRDSVSDGVIIDQIRATRSKFLLSTDDIVRLRNEGVSDMVISEMIRSSEKSDQPGRSELRWYYDPYYYWWWGAPSYAWYPSVRNGFAYHLGHVRASAGVIRRTSGRSR